MFWLTIFWALMQTYDFWVGQKLLSCVGGVFFFCEEQVDRQVHHYSGTGLRVVGVRSRAPFTGRAELFSRDMKQSHKMFVFSGCPGCGPSLRGPFLSQLNLASLQLAVWSYVWRRLVSTAPSTRIRGSNHQTINPSYDQGLPDKPHPRCCGCSFGSRGFRVVPVWHNPVHAFDTACVRVPPFLRPTSGYYCLFL